MSSKILFQPKYFLGMLIRSRSSYQVQPSWLKTSYLFLCVLCLELYYCSLRINWNTVWRASNVFRNTAKAQVGREKQQFLFSLSIGFLNYSVAFALHWPTETWAWDSVNAGDDKLFHYLWLSYICYHQTRQRLIIKRKKLSPMISLTSSFCHRLIQNSSQVTWTTRQSGNVSAATKGTSFWVLAVISPQYPQATVIAVPPNFLLIRKECSL